MTKQAKRNPLKVVILDNSSKELYETFEDLVMIQLIAYNYFDKNIKDFAKIFSIKAKELYKLV